MLFLGMGANLGNGYYDHVSGADLDNPASGTLSGGSGLIKRGLLPASFFFRWSMIFSIIPWIPTFLEKRLEQISKKEN